MSRMPQKLSALRVNNTFYFVKFELDSFFSGLIYVYSIQFPRHVISLFVHFTSFTLCIKYDAMLISIASVCLGSSYMENISIKSKVKDRGCSISR